MYIIRICITYNREATRVSARGAPTAGPMCSCGLHQEMCTASHLMRETRPRDCLKVVRTRASFLCMRVCVWLMQPTPSGRRSVRCIIISTTSRKRRACVSLAVSPACTSFRRFIREFRVRSSSRVAELFSGIGNGAREDLSVCRSADNRLCSGECECLRFCVRECLRVLQSAFRVRFGVWRFV